MSAALGSSAPWPTQADLGGRSGHGQVLPEAEGELFHAAWEPRVLAMTLAMGATGAWNIDLSRAARETLPGYADSSYYQIWFAALQRLMLARGLVSPDEIAAGHALPADVSVSLPPASAEARQRRLAAADVPAVLARGASTERPSTQAARFALGDAVRTRASVATHHTRLPRYASGKRGVIERLHGMHVFADAHAQGLGEQPQWLYTVVFDGAELWGAELQGDGTAPAGLRVSVDAWEPYLVSVESV